MTTNQLEELLCPCGHRVTRHHWHGSRGSFPSTTISACDCRCPGTTVSICDCRLTKFEALAAAGVVMRPTVKQIEDALIASAGYSPGETRIAQRVYQHLWPTPKHRVTDEQARERVRQQNPGLWVSDQATVTRSTMERELYVGTDELQATVQLAEDEC